MTALQAALGKDWGTVTSEANAVKTAADWLISTLATHEWTRADAVALAHGVVATALDGNDLDYSAAQQQVMALRSIVAAMKASGFANDQQLTALNEALGPLNTAIADDQTYDADAYASALKALNGKLPQ
jgi:hypothetical protein